jgi:hypothetical protein
VAHGVDPALLQAGCAESRIPLAEPPFFDLHMAATRRGEEDRRIDPRRHRVERLEDASAERYESFRHGLRALLELAAREALADADEPPVTIDV